MSVKSHISHGVYQFLMKRSRRRCEWCGSQHDIHIDHIRPRCCGGTNRRGNLQVLCNKCGQWKGGDPPELVIKRIRRLKVKGAWERSVKHWGLQAMTEFCDRERDAAESDVVDSFDNPLTIVLGEGKVQLQFAMVEGGQGIVFGLHGETGEIGSQGESILGDKLQRNQVFVKCLNQQAAEALFGVAYQLMQSFQGDAPQLPSIGLPEFDGGESEAVQNCTEVKWKRFHFESNMFFDGVEGPEDWQRLRAAYPNLTDDQFLEAKEATYDGTLSVESRNKNPNFGFRHEHDGEKTLRDFFVAHDMLALIPPRA